MKITFYGVRGSIPVSGEPFVKYGGNTPCVHVELNCGQHLILDAGTGLLSLGKALDVDSLSEKPVALLLTHQHWDHIQGFPFFNPIYRSGITIDLYSPTQNSNQEFPILDQFGGPSFPLTQRDLSADINKHYISAGESFSIVSAQISAKKINHPGGGVAYKIVADGINVIYVTDNELFPLTEPATTFEEWIEFVHSCDLLIHDAQFTKEEINSKRGWGHSCIDDALELGLQADVKNLALFHHYCEHDDTQMDKIEATSQAYVAEKNSSMNVFCAKQEQTITL